MGVASGKLWNGNTEEAVGRLTSCLGAGIFLFPLLPLLNSQAKGFALRLVR